MTRLSELIDEAAVRDLREQIASGSFPGVAFNTAMEFLLSDGIMPESGLPVASLLALEDWVRARWVSNEVVGSEPRADGC